MKSAAPDFDCLVIGAGVIGLVMASLLIARRRVARGRVAVIADRFSTAVPEDGADWDLRVFALSRASRRVLEACGVWQKLPPGKIFAYERMCVWDARGRPEASGSLTFDCAELGEPNLGHIVEGRALSIESLRAAREAGVVCIEGVLTDVVNDEEGVRVRLGDGRELRARLLIGADGTESKTRSLLGIETAGHSYGQDALVAHVRTAKSHENTAWQRFLPTGPLAFLPMPDGRSSIVWSNPPGEATRLRALDAAGFASALTAASDGVLGACEPTTPVVAYPLRLQYATDYVRTRAALLGDAAHVVHPLAGQGLNLGLLDCATLVTVLGGAERNDDLGPAVFGEQRLLRRYQRWRRSENLLTAMALDGLERLFGNDNPLLSRLRGFGLGAVGRMPFVKRELALRAMGISGDVPGFLKGG